MERVGVKRRNTGMKMRDKENKTLSGKDTSEGETQYNILNLS
jgi:hypothetical protein